MLYCCCRSSCFRGLQNSMISLLFIFESSEVDCSNLRKCSSSSSYSLEDECCSAKRASGVMLLPGLDAHLMEILFALVAIFQIFIFLIHLCKADSAVGVILQINILGILFVCWHSAFESICELIIENFICCLWYGWSCWPEVIEDLIILSYLSHNEEDVLAGFFLHSEVNASAVYTCWGCDIVCRATRLYQGISTPRTVKDQLLSFLWADNRNILWCLLL